MCLIETRGYYVRQSKRGSSEMLMRIIFSVFQSSAHLVYVASKMCLIETRGYDVRQSKRASREMMRIMFSVFQSSAHLVYVFTWRKRVLFLLTERVKCV